MVIIGIWTIYSRTSATFRTYKASSNNWECWDPFLGRWRDSTRQRHLKHIPMLLGIAMWVACVGKLWYWKDWKGDAPYNGDHHLFWEWSRWRSLLELWPVSLVKALSLDLNQIQLQHWTSWPSQFGLDLLTSWGFTKMWPEYDLFDYFWLVIIYQDATCPSTWMMDGPFPSGEPPGVQTPAFPAHQADSVAQLQRLSCSGVPTLPSKETPISKYRHYMV